MQDQSTPEQLQRGLKNRHIQLIAPAQSETSLYRT